MTDLRPDTVTWITGAPMLLVDRGMVEHLVTRPDGTSYVLRYRVGALKPMSTERSREDGRS